MLPASSENKFSFARQLSPPSCLTPTTLHPWWRCTPTYLLPSPLICKCATLTVSDSESLAHHILLRSRQAKHGWEMRGGKCIVSMRKNMKTKKCLSYDFFLRDRAQFPMKMKWPKSVGYLRVYSFLQKVVFTSQIFSLFKERKEFTWNEVIFPLLRQKMEGVFTDKLFLFFFFM